jgi:hypothetical protein
MPNYRQLLNGIGGAGGAIGVGTWGALDQFKDEPWVGDLRDVLHPPRYTDYPEDPRIGGYRMGQTVEPAPDEAAAAQAAREAAATRGRGELAPSVAIQRRFGEFAPLSPPGRAEAFRMGGIADVNEAPANVWRQYDKATAPSLVEMMNEPGDVGKLGPELQQKLFTDDLRARQRAADPASYRQGAAPRPGPLAPGGSLDKPILGALNPALEMYLPNDASPLNAGLAVATGPVGGKLVRGGAAALGALFEPDEAEAGAGRILRDPRLWSPISSQKLRKPLDEMAHQYTDVRNPVPRFVQPEDLVGGYGLFTPWDLSAANKTLTHVDDLKLANAVRLHGGVGFPEANPGMAAASEQAISRRLDNQAARLTDETGKPVYIMPMTMSPSGIDASHHVADPLSQLVQTAKITKKDAKAFDDVMREQVPDWVGIKNKKFPDYINNLQGGMTTKALMADRMALAQWQEKGFPDVAAIRHATSEPALIDMPRNTTGMAISRYIPGQGLLDTTHPSYPKGVAGQYMGQLASLVPFDAAAPSIAEGLAAYNARNKALGKKVMSTPAYHLQKPHEGVPTAQYFDDQWAEGIRKQWGDIK